MLAPQILNLFFPPHSFTGSSGPFLHYTRARQAMCHHTAHPQCPHLAQQHHTWADAAAAGLNSFHARLLAWAVFFAAEEKKGNFLRLAFAPGIYLKKLWV